MAIIEFIATHTGKYKQSIAAHVCQLQIQIVGVHGRQTFAMLITYYDKRKEDLVNLKSAKEIVISLDHETGLLEMTYKVGKCYFTNYLPITTSIVIGDEND